MIVKVRDERIEEDASVRYFESLPKERQSSTQPEKEILMHSKTLKIRKGIPTKIIKEALDCRATGRLTSAKGRQRVKMNITHSNMDGKKSPNIIFYAPDADEMLPSESSRGSIF